VRLARVALCIFSAWLIALLSAFGQSDSPSSFVSVPRFIRIHGTVRDQQANPITGNVGITFTLYGDENGSASLWQEVQNVRLDRAGRYNILLGSTNENGLPLEIFSAGEARWLGVRPDGLPEQPRILLLSVPYALKAGDADSLGGKPASAFLLSPSPGFSLEGLIARANSNSLAVPSGIRAIQALMEQTACSGVTSDGTATANQLAKFTSACNIQNSAIFESGGNVGIGNTNPGGALDVSGTGVFQGSLLAEGGAVMTPTGTATPSQGFISNPLDLSASVFSASLGKPATITFQWQAVPVGNNTSNIGASLNLLYGVTGSMKETGISVDRNGILSFATGQTFPGTGSGTVTSVGTGAGLTGGPITSSGTISIPNAGVTNAMLANNSITVKAGSGLSGGGAVSLGSTVTLTNADPGLGGTVSSVGSGTGLTGGPITTTGTLSLDTTYTDGRYLQLAGGTLTGALKGTSATFSGALTGKGATFAATVSANGTLLPSLGTATASQGFSSSPSDWQASSFSSKTSSAVPQDFRWLAEPTANNTANPSGSFNLLFGSNGNTPTETGLSIGHDGIITFASGQTFPGAGGGTVTSVGTGAGLTGGPITTSGTISIANSGVTNSMLANPSITVQAGSGLSGGGTVALGGTVTLTGNLSGTKNGIGYFSNASTLTSTAAPTNGQLLVGSTGNAPVLTTLNAGQNVTITNGAGSITISASGGGGGTTLPFFVTGTGQTEASQGVTANTTNVWGILFPFNVITTEVTYDVKTADNTANNYDLGIFSNTGTLLVNLGPTPGTTFAPSKGFRTLNWVQGSTSLPAGRYYLALTTNCSATCSKLGGSPSFVSFAVNVSAGSSKGGTLPASITPPAGNWSAGTQPVVVIK
jgi:trimeric autotransporter adhesin